MDGQWHHQRFRRGDKRIWNTLRAMDTVLGLDFEGIRQRAARETFTALDCRDVARIDLRMNREGQVYVLEVNPLPGLTPDYSDLVLISKAAGITYRTLIGEILAGSLKRLREKRREAVPKAAGDDKRERTDRVEKIDAPAPKPEVAT